MNKFTARKCSGHEEQKTEGHWQCWESAAGMRLMRRRGKSGRADLEGTPELAEEIVMT